MTKNSHPFDPYWISSSFLPVYEWLCLHQPHVSYHPLDRPKLARQFDESGCVQWFFTAETWQQLEQQQSTLNVQALSSSMPQNVADGALYYLSESGLAVNERLPLFCRLWNHIHGYVKLTLQQQGNVVTLRCTAPPDLCTALEADFWLALIACFLVRSPQLSQARLTLHGSTARRLLLDERIAVQPETSASGWLELHLPPEEDVLGYDDFVLDSAIEGFVLSLAPTDDIMHKASRAFLNDAGDWPDIDVFASTNGMTTRSLQRRLDELGLSYSTLIDIHRRQRAYLLEKYLSQAEIADRLGYREVTNFTRAYNRWYD